jgi:hypothetical protein
VLHLTKSGAGPHERVLAGVRQRGPGSDVAPDAVPVAMVDIAPGAVAPPAAPPGDSSGTGGNGYLMPDIIGAPFGFPGSPGGFPVGPAVSGISPGTAGGPDSPNSPPGNTDTPSGGSPNSPPGNTDTPPGGGPNSPPGNTDTPPGGGPPTTIPVPEPATWPLMALGLIVLLVMRRNRFGRTD